MELARHGRTITGDLILSAKWGSGVYLAVGRLDGGINFRFQRTYRKLELSRERFRVVFGPFDIMWSRKWRGDSGG